MRATNDGSKHFTFPAIGWIALLCIAVAISGAIGFVIGVLAEDAHFYSRRFNVESQTVNAVLARLGPNFSNVYIDTSSTGEVYLEGSVGNKQDRDELVKEMKDEFGIKGGESRAEGVKVVMPSSRPSPAPEELQR